MQILRGSAHNISEDHKHSSPLHIFSVWLDPTYFCHYRSRTGISHGSRHRNCMSLYSVLSHLGFVRWWKQLIRKTAGRRERQMEKVRHRSTRRKEMATLKWVSTRSPVKGTRAKLATNTKEQSNPFTLYCSHRDFQDGNFIWNIMFNSHS